MLDNTVNNIGQLHCASASVLRYTASVLASASNPTASVLVSVSASSALVTTLLECNVKWTILKRRKRHKLLLGCFTQSYYMLLCAQNDRLNS